MLPTDFGGGKKVDESVCIGVFRRCGRAPAADMGRADGEFNRMRAMMREPISSCRNFPT